MTRRPWIANLRRWTFPEDAILGGDLNERGLWGQQWSFHGVELVPKNLQTKNRGSLYVVTTVKETYDMIEKLFKSGKTEPEQLINYGNVLS